jgi:hypothetical protein
VLRKQADLVTQITPILGILRPLPWLSPLYKSNCNIIAIKQIYSITTRKF